jgi:hypothetical protein
MAPVSVSAVGVPRQIIDDPELVDLAARLSSFADRLENDGSNWEVVDAPNLILELSKYSVWCFQEQVSVLSLFPPIFI